VARHDAAPLDEARAMMAGIFAVLLIAFLLQLAGLRRVGVLFLLVCFALSVGLFLWEVYSPDYGFRMPWLVF
jgi:hypothetical protein